MSKPGAPLLAVAFLLCAPSLRAEGVEAPASAMPATVQSWRGYAAGFSSPSGIPALKVLGLNFDTEARFDAFTRVMARTGLSPESVRPELSAEQQAALIGTSAADYGRRLAQQAEDLPENADPGTLGGEFNDIAAVEALVPPAERARLAAGHGKVERLAALQEGALAGAVDERVKRVADLWSGKRAEGLPEPALASVFGQTSGAPAPASWRLQPAAPGKRGPASPPVPAPRKKSVFGRIASAPVKAVRGVLGFFDMLWNGIFPPKLPAANRLGADAPKSGSASRLAIVTEGDPILVRPAAEVPPRDIPTTGFQRFLDDMVFTLGTAGGVGLAAPQVGKGIKVAVVRFGGEPLIMINPKLSVLSARETYHLEGCLSMPDACAFVPRPSKIQVDYLDRAGNAQSLILSRIQAVIVQHELDHLDGILFTMRSPRYLKKFGLGGARRLSRDSQAELAGWLARLNPEERAALSAASARMSRDFYDITEPESLSSSLREGLGLAGEEDVFREVLAYHEIRISQEPPAQKTARLKAWIKSTSHALFAYDDLSTSQLSDSPALLEALTAELPDMALLKNPYLRAPPFASPKAVTIKNQAKGKNETVSFPTVEQAVEFSVLAAKYRLVRTAEGYRLRLDDDSGSVYVTAKTIEGALLVARAREATPDGRAEDMALPASPQRRVGFDEDKPITFGLESEMNIRENPNLVEDYLLYHMSEEEWLALPREERIRLARAEEKKHRKGDPFLRKLSTAPKQLPSSLLAEGDGNCEMNGFVFTTFDELRDFIGFIDERYGPSSLQGHVVYKNHEQLEGVAGWVIFEGDAAQLKTLEKGYERLLSDPAALPGKNLAHHSLGPLGEDDRSTFLRFELRAVQGKTIGNPGNSRVTYAPVFRDDKYPAGAKGHEFRQFHKRSAELLAAMDDFSAHMQRSGDLSAFKPFGRMVLINESSPIERSREYGVPIDKKIWRSFFSDVGTFIDDKYPSLTKGGAPTTERFFFPLRDWRNHPVVLGLAEPERSAVQARIEDATRKYLSAAGNLAARYGGAPVDDAALAGLQTAAARWAYEVRLSDHLIAFRRRTLGATSERGPPQLARWPGVRSVTTVPRDARIVDELPFEAQQFPDGRRYTRYKMVKGLDADSESYRKFMDSSLEVLYKSAMPYGHINLRVGRRLYSMNYVTDTSQRDFSPVRVGKGKTGFIYFVDQARIKEIQDELEKLYLNSAANNLPPFDAESPQLDIVRKKDGTLKFRSPFMVFANNKTVNAQIIEQNGEAFLRTADGFTYPVTKKGDDYCTQSLACATSATYVMRKYFDIAVDFNHGAKSLRDDLARGNPKGRAPDAIIDY